MFSNSIDSPQHCENTMAILSSFKEEPLLHLLPKMNFNMTAIESCYQNDFQDGTFKSCSRTGCWLSATYSLQ